MRAGTGGGFGQHRAAGAPAAVQPGRSPPVHRQFAMGQVRFGGLQVACTTHNQLNCSMTAQVQPDRSNLLICHDHDSWRYRLNDPCRLWIGSNIILQVACDIYTCEC